MPFSASRKRPLRSRSAPVNAPRTWPKSSLSRRFAGIAPQLTPRNGCFARGPATWMARRDDLLAGAALARDEDGHVGVLDAIDEGVDLSHRGARADEPRVAEVAAELRRVPA